MKFSILFMTLMLAQLATLSAQAIPVANENVANSGTMTIYPDHADQHHYYVAPNVVRISMNESGVPYFSYNEYRKNMFQNYAVLTMTLVPTYTRQELEVAEAEILKKDPAAQFSGVPFVASSLKLSGEIAELIADNQCNHEAGLIGQEQACTLVLTPKGKNIFLSSLARKTVFATLHFDYQIQVVQRMGDNSFKDETLSFGLAVVIDGDQLSHYPQLINRR